MIPNKSATIERKGSLGGEKIAGHVNEEGLALLMNVATNLYADKVLACVREYSTNALDSHIMAGQARPIEVTLPNYLTPDFVVRDYGLGMDADDIRSTYSGYGNSTKRGVANANGVLGIGSKAALSYTHSFTVTGWKNGMQTSVLITRSESGVLEAEIVSVVPSSEETGVEVRIPAASGVFAFGQAAGEFFKFWETGKALVDNKELSLLHKAQEISEHCFFFGNSSSARVHLLMGGVAYPVNRKHFDIHSLTSKDVLIVVDITDPEYAVDFTPTREALNYNEHTRAILDKIKDELYAAMDEKIKDISKSCTNPVQEYKLVATIVETLGVSSAYANGRGQTYSTPPDPFIWKKEGQANITEWDYLANRYSVVTRRPYVMNYSVVTRRPYVMNNAAVRPETVFVTNYPSPEAGVPSTHKSKFRQFFANRNEKPQTVYLINCDLSEYTEYPEEFKTLDWSEVLEWYAEERKSNRASSPPPPRSKAKKSGVYHSFLMHADVDMSNCHVVYGKKGEISSIAGRASHFYNDNNLHFVVVSSQQHDRLKRTVKKATPFAEFHRQFRADQMDKEFNDLPREHFALVALGRTYGSSPQGLAHKLGNDPSKIDDPALKEIVNLSTGKTVESAVTYQLEVTDRYRAAVQKAERPEWKTLDKTYPLLVGYHRTGAAGEAIAQRHMIEYVNGVYARKGESQ